MNECFLTFLAFVKHGIFFRSSSDVGLVSPSIVFLVPEP